MISKTLGAPFFGTILEGHQVLELVISVPSTPPFG
jgi:hypothetical protein